MLKKIQTRGHTILRDVIVENFTTRTIKTLCIDSKHTAPFLEV